MINGYRYLPFVKPERLYLDWKSLIHWAAMHGTTLLRTKTI